MSDTASDDQNAGPATMKAAGQERFGGPEEIHEITLPRPKPGISEILVRVHAAGINPTDWKHRAGQSWFPEPSVPLGWDVSGVVEAVGLGSTLFEPGDEVFGMLPYPHGVGSHAEYVVGPTRAFVRKPAEIDHIQAGALPLAALTAWQALVDTAGVAPGDRVLIHAAAGGVGHLAVQIAKARGAYVIGTASAPQARTPARAGRRRDHRLPRDRLRRSRPRRGRRARHDRRRLPAAVTPDSATWRNPRLHPAATCERTA
ncbi:NADP-dependent oxidoreductase [Arthrobacter woluwensis]|uniref:NADP-dependent oxidoreductase n=1 Tax=Arthrobacter woluwensis TaxID=156980 RepID=UPI00349EC5BF